MKNGLVSSTCDNGKEVITSNKNAKQRDKVQ